MKGLVDRLRESLLDDADELIAKTDFEVLKSHFNDPESPWRQYFKICKNTLLNQCDKQDTKFELDDKNLIIMNPIVNCTYNQVIQNLLDRNNMTIYGEFNFMNFKGDMNSDILPKSIKCCSLKTKNISNFKNLKIVIDNDMRFNGQKYTSPPSVCVFGASMDRKVFNNVFIKSSTKNLMIMTNKFPQFNNFKCTCEYIYINGPRIFDESIKEINDIFAFPFNITVNEYGLEKELIIRDFKSLLSLTKSRKYKVSNNDTGMFKLSDVKLSSIFDLSKSPHTKCIVVSDGDNILQFDNGQSKYNKGNLLGSQKNIYTKDGWRVSIYKK